MADVAVEKLAAGHRLDAFDSGAATLDEWLRRWALTAARDGSAQTYVAARDGRVLGFYSICAASVRPEEASARVAKGQSRRPVPVILLARLAVDRSEQGRGLGAALLKDAILRIASAADVIGARAVLVHALDETARRFYEHFGFEPSAVDPLHLFLLLKDIRRSPR